MEEGKIDSAADYDDTRAGLQARWDVEIAAAKENQKDFWAQGDEVVKEFLGEGDKGKRLNLFHADVVTKGAQLFGNVPKIRARRRFGDASDDRARVSSEALERLLSTDIERDEDGFQTSLDNALGDWLKPGLGQIRFRYVVETEMGEETPAQVHPETGEEMAPAVPAQEVKSFEDVETDYVYWRDYLWSPCRTWSDVRWTAYKVELSIDAAHERYDSTAGEGDEEKGKRLVSMLPRREKDEAKRQDDSAGVKDAWSRVEIWEVWDKESRRVIHMAEGFTVVLDVVDDPLGLPNFFPSPKPLFANSTTSKLMPKADYMLVKDQYKEAHELTQRISLLVEAIKVAGIYDQANEGIQKLLDKAAENVLIPVANWAAFMENGGMSGGMAFLPLEQTVAAVVQLIQQRNLVKQSIYEITGMSNTMRGQADPNATATAERVMARFGGTRIVADQRELARFASEAQRIRGCIIAKHFDPATIIKRSNMAKSPDAALLPQAVDLLKSDVAKYQIEVDAESLSMTDFDAQQQEGIAIMQATAEFFKNFAPLMSSPTIGTFVLELYQQFITQFRGANRFESIIDRGIDQLKRAAAQPPQPPPPDPRLETEKVKAQAAIQGAQLDMQGKVLDLQTKKVEFGMDMRKMAAEQQMDQANFGMRMAEARDKRESEADMPMMENT